MNKTQIEWVRNPDGTQGYTWNPITGCLNGCPYCYARKLANRRLKQRYLANTNLAPNAKGGVAKLTIGDRTAIEREGDYALPFYPRFWEERLYHPWGGKPRGIFTCDMSDLFGIGIPEGWTETIIDLAGKHDQNRYYLLTKQPQNLIRFSPFPDNCWVGVTATDAQSSLSALRGLENIEAKVKYISFEPLLDYVGGLWLGDWLKSSVGIGWLIIGAQTKPYKPPKIEWVEEIVKAADGAGIPVFLKKNLSPILTSPLEYRWAFTEDRGCHAPQREMPR